MNEKLTSCPTCPGRHTGPAGPCPACAAPDEVCKCHVAIGRVCSVCGLPTTPATTAGPWQVEDTRTSVLPFSVFSASGPAIAACPTREDAEAIVAAMNAVPVLLEACRDALGLIGEEPDYVSCMAAKRIRAAIRQAEGHLTESDLDRVAPNGRRVVEG